MSIVFNQWQKVTLEETSEDQMFDVKRVVYTGSDDKLKGKTALMRATPYSTIVEVQFDDVELEESHGWHQFCPSVFKEVK